MIILLINTLIILGGIASLFTATHQNENSNHLSQEFAQDIQLLANIDERLHHLLGLVVEGRQSKNIDAIITQIKTLSEQYTVDLSILTKRPDLGYIDKEVIQSEIAAFNKTYPALPDQSIEVLTRLRDYGKTDQTRQDLQVLTELLSQTLSIVNNIRRIAGIKLEENLAKSKSLNKAFQQSLVVPTILLTIILTFSWYFLTQLNERMKLEASQNEANLKVIESSRETLDNILSSATAGVFMVDEQGLIKYVNKSWVRLTGTSFDQSIKKHWFTAVHPEDESTVEKIWQAFLKGEAAFSHKLRILGSKGEISWVQVSVSRLASKPDHPGGFVGIMWDITNSIETENELKLLKSTFDNFVIMTRTDERGNITYVNDAFVRISKYDRHEILGKNHRILKSGTHNAEFFKNIWKTISGGYPWHGEICNRAKDGSLYWVDTTILPILNSSGRISGYLSARYEITDIKQQLSTLNTYLSYAPDLIFEVNSDLQIIFANKRSSDLFSDSNLGNMSFLELVPESEHSSISYSIKNVIDSGTPETIYHSYCSRNDQLSNIQTRITPLGLNSEAKSAIITSTIISTRSLSDPSALQNENETKLRFIVKQTHIVVWQLDLATNEISLDGSLFEGLDSKESSNLLKNWKSYVTYLDRETLIRHGSNCLETGDSFAYTLEVNFPEQGPRHIKITGKRFEADAKRPLGLMGIAQDVTQEVNQTFLKEKQKIVNFQASKMAALSDMASGMAHEINNPLAIIRGKSELLAMLSHEGLVSQERLSKDTQTINQAADRIAGIVKSLQSFSKNFSQEPFSQIEISKLIDDVVVYSREKFVRSGVSLRLDEVAPFRATFRHTYASQCLHNLIANAFDAALESKEKWVSISTHQDDEFVHIKVIDSGSGVPKSVVEKIWQPFFTTKAPNKGSGLGLSVAKGLIEATEGTIKLDLSVKNTCFVISLPRKISSRPI